MTITIGAFGPNCAQAVLKGLRAAESIATGSIGGFAAFAAITDTRDVFRSETNRGGSRTLFVEGEQTGVDVPEAAQRSTMAALISSGPDRLFPAAYIAVDSAVGIVTGHRLPNTLSVQKKPLNQETLDLMSAGKSVYDAVNITLDQNPEADAGIMALHLRGNIYSRNSERVRRRPDTGFARLSDTDMTAVVEVLHNSIRPRRGLAKAVTEIVLERMIVSEKTTGRIEVKKGVPIRFGRNHKVLINQQGLAAEIISTDPLLTQGEHNCVAIQLGCEVWQEGRCIGKTLIEANTIVRNGSVISFNGMDRFIVTFAPEQGR